MYETGKTPSSTAIDTALSTLEGLAMQAPAKKEAIRCARHADSVLVDLGDDTGRIVQITGDGWTVRRPDPTMPVFRRGANTRPIPEPARNGSLDVFASVFGLQPAVWELIKGWLIVSVIPGVPVPILWLEGLQGSGKSFVGLHAANVLDPRESLGSAPGRNFRDELVAAHNRYIPGYDNVSSLSPSTSDAMCRLVTGDHFEARKLYTGTDSESITVRRAAVATSIGLPSGMRPDLLERIVPVHMERMPPARRLSETELRRRFDEAHPVILGGLFDLVSVALRPSDATAEHRMKDYVDTLARIDAATGSDMAGAVARSSAGVFHEIAEDDSFAQAVIGLLGDKDEVTGSAAELFAMARRHRDLSDDESPFPRSPSAFARMLGSKSELLRAVGITTERRQSNGSKIITVRNRVGI